MRDFDVISLDIETSGRDYLKHTLLSIGCVRLSDFSTFYAETRQESFEIEPEAARIHGLDLTNRDAQTLPTMSQVDGHLRDWLKSDPFYKEGKNYCTIPMGFNVGSFDLEFVQKYLPKSAAILGYRSIDLNALLFVESLKHEDSRFYDLKRTAKEIGKSFALAHVPDLQAHNALFDAWSNVGVFYHLVNVDASVKVGPVEWEGGKS